MAVTTTVYDINDRAWTLTINGNTPNSLNLTNDGIIIEYPDYQVDEPLILQKFTFKFLGDLSTVEAFGIIGVKTHSFVLTHITATGTTYTWRGYLSETLFNLANTGFDETISINGISQIEALKYTDFDMSGDELVKISDIVAYCLTGVSYGTVSYKLSFTLANLGYISIRNWYDEEGQPFNRLDVIKYICTFYTMIFDIDFQENIIISSYSELQRQPNNILNYANTKHKGIDETYSNSQNFLSAQIDVSILKPTDVTVQLSTDNVAELPYLNGLSTNLNDGYFLESRLHVIEKDEYPGWEFPKYRSTDNQPIADWWDKSKLLETFNVPELSFPNQRIVDVPVAGMYRMSYRYWPENVGNPPAQLSNCFYIKTYNKQYPVDSSPLRTINNTASNPSYPYAHFSSVFTAGVKSCLLFSGKMGVSGRWGYSQWHWQYPQYSILGLRQYNGFIITASTNQTTINVFGGLDNIINGKDIRDTGYFGRFSDVFTPLPSHLRYGSNYILLSHLVLEVQFRGKWFNSQTEDWQDTRAFIRPELETPMSQEDIVSQIKDHYPPFEVPLYEDLGRGYAMPFGKRQDGTGTDNSGTGTLDIKLYFVNKLGDNFVPFTFWLQDFNFNLVDLADSVQLKSAPKSVQYQYGNKTKPARQKITNYLMSEYDDIVSFSQVYTDNENTKLDTLSYILPVFAGLGVTSTFNVTEKPEYHTLRIIKELISSQVIISDIIPFKDFQSKRLVYYKNNLLVRDGYNIDALNDIVNVNYIIRKQNYTYIMVTIHTTPVNAVPRSATYQYFNSAGGYTIRQSQSQQSDNNVQVIVDDVLPEPGAEQKQIIYVQPSENVEKIWDGSQFKTVSTNTKIVAGRNISISPTTGLGDVTVTAADPPVTKIVAGSNVTISPSAGTGDVTINSADPGVTKITAGSNVTISPTGGTGNVTITATSPGVTSIVAGDYITISPTTGTGAVTVSVNLDTLKTALGL